MKRIKITNQQLANLANFIGFNLTSYSLPYPNETIKQKNFALMNHLYPIFPSLNTLLGLINQPKLPISLFWQSYNQIANITQEDQP